jgi:hypothetical protein
MRISAKHWIPDPGIGLGLTCFVALTLCSAQSTSNPEPPSHVENNTFISPNNPKIRVKVDERLDYIGEVPFTIDNLASGIRYVFVRTTLDNHIQHMFIIQKEGFLSSSDDTYKYRITNPARLGAFEYQHSVVLEDNAATIREEPGKEADLTERFLKARGYALEPELVMSRFARPSDPQHKHEIIFFCFENLSAYGHSLADLSAGRDDPIKDDIKKKVAENCCGAFRVNH